MNRLDEVERRTPEWAPWLAVVREALHAAQDAAWDAFVPAPGTARTPGAPRLAGAHVQPDHLLDPYWSRLTARAGAVKAPGLARLPALRPALPLARAAFRAALEADEPALEALAAEAGVEPAGFYAIAMLVPVPFLHACNRRLAPPAGWSEGYCPCCGAWPALAEICGVERQRLLRCGRCGAAWPTVCLACPYCGVNDDETLGSLVPERDGARAAIEICRNCGGYLKALTTLGPVSPAEVLPSDLATVELDIAAHARGFRRPEGTGYSLRIAVNSE